MGVPSTRTPVRIARGTYANLSTVDALAAIDEGEICFATDQGRLYVKQGAGLTSISSTNEVAPTPAEVTASPAFTGGTGTQSDPYLLTNVGSPFSGGSLTSAHELTISGTAGDIAVFTDNSPTASADRFKGQDVGILNAAGEFKLNLKYADNPVTTTDNTTYTGNLQIGTTYITWVVVQSNLAPLSEDTTTTITSGSGVGDVVTATPGTATGGTAPHSSSVKWQRSFTGLDGWFDTGSTGENYTITSADAGYYVRAVSTVTDSTDAAQGGPLTIDLPSAPSGQLNTNQVATISSLTLSEDDTSGARFTSQSYSLDAILNPDGTPTSTKSVKVKFGGTFDTFPQTDNVSTVTSDDPIANNVNATGKLYYEHQAGGYTSSSSIRNWNQVYYTGEGGSGWVIAPMYIPNGNGFQMKYNETDGFSNETPYVNLSTNSTSFGTSVDMGYQYYTDTTLSTYRQMYQNSSGSNQANTVYHFEMYKPDCVLMYSNHSKWVTIDDFSIRKSNSEHYAQWKPIAQMHDISSGGDAKYMKHLTLPNGERISVYPAWNTYDMVIWNGDLTDYENCTATVVSNLAQNHPSLPSGYSQGNARGIVVHGTKVTVFYQHYVSASSNYRYRAYTCDFSINDGKTRSHWVFKDEFYDLSSGNGVLSDFSLGNSPGPNPENENEIYITFGSYNPYYSSDGGENWVARPRPEPSGWTMNGSPQGVIWHRGRLICFAKGLYLAEGSDQNSNQYWYWAQSSDSGSNWTVAQYNNVRVSTYNNGTGGIADCLSPNYYNTVRQGAGWLLAQGGLTYHHGNSYYNRMGFWMKDRDVVTLSGTTNLSNSSIRLGNRLSQPGTNPGISGELLSIDGTDMQFINMSGQTAFETGKPLQNTVSYFGGSQANLYAVLSGAGAVTDLTSSDPGFVNLGYGADNTITFPATFPSGNAPDVELPAGTTIQTTMEFANSQGTVSTDSNTLTP
tara:strand:- start:575 stop:3448 length:2874 start_codon:yes stop_codon:yes gene_type:complete